MNIFTERMILRSFKTTDAEDFFKIVCEDDIKQYVPGAYVKTRSHALENIKIYKKGDLINDFYFAIENKKTGEFLGAIIATRMTQNEIDVAYFISKSHRKCGFMKEALSVFLKQIGGWNKRMEFKFAIDKKNIPSIRLMKSLNIPMYNESDAQYFFKFSGGMRHDN